LYQGMTSVVPQMLQKKDRGFSPCVALHAATSLSADGVSAAPQVFLQAAGKPSVRQALYQGTTLVVPQTA
jgi:hypothetical protein